MLLRIILRSDILVRDRPRLEPLSVDNDLVGADPEKVGDGLVQLDDGHLDQDVVGRLDAVPSHQEKFEERVGGFPDVQFQFCSGTTKG